MNGTVTMPLEDYEKIKKKINNLELDAYRRVKEIDDLVCIFKKIGIDRDVINKIDTNTINVFQDFSIDLDTLKYRIEFETVCK